MPSQKGAKRLGFSGKASKPAPSGRSTWGIPRTRPQKALRTTRKALKTVKVTNREIPTYVENLRAHKALLKQKIAAKKALKQATSRKWAISQRWTRPNPESSRPK